MKLISCTHCGAKYIGPKTAAHPRGQPVLFGRWTGGSHPIIVKCHRCTNAFKLSAIDFNRLPVVDEEELEGLGLSVQPAVQLTDLSGTTPREETDA